MCDIPRVLLSPAESPSLWLLPGLLTRRHGPDLSVSASGTTLTTPQAVLVSNNPYGTADPTGLGRRERLDTGLLGVLGIRVDSAAEAAGLLLDPEPDGLTELTTREVVVTADCAEIEVGLDGEAATLSTPVNCRIAPGTLRVRVPRHRPGVPRSHTPLDWRKLRKLAASVGRTAAPGLPNRSGRSARP